MSQHTNVYIPPEGPPQGINPNPKIFAAMGEDNIYKMLEDFYLALGQSSIRAMFPEDLVGASKRSAAFFVFILGGPPIYQQKYGSPMMRKRHMAFKIDEEARRVWLECFKKILKDSDEKYQLPKEYLDEFIHFLDKFSGWMVNTQ